MRSIRKLLFGASVRLAMIPLSVPCLFATCCCCCAAFGTDEAHWSSPGDGLVVSLGGPQNVLAKGGTHPVDSSALVAGTAKAPYRCGCCPVKSDTKRPAVVRRSTESRTKLIRGTRIVHHTVGVLSGSRATDSRSSALARAASCPTSAENCILLCRLLL